MSMPPRVQWFIYRPLHVLQCLSWCSDLSTVPSIPEMPLECFTLPRRVQWFILYICFKCHQELGYLSICWNFNRVRWIAKIISKLNLCETLVTKSSAAWMLLFRALDFPSMLSPSTSRGLKSTPLLFLSSSNVSPSALTSSKESLNSSESSDWDWLFLRCLNSLFCGEVLLFLSRNVSTLSSDGDVSFFWVSCDWLFFDLIDRWFWGGDAGMFWCWFGSLSPSCSDDVLFWRKNVLLFCSVVEVLFSSWDDMLFSSCGDSLFCRSFGKLFSSCVGTLFCSCAGVLFCCDGSKFCSCVGKMFFRWGDSKSWSCVDKLFFERGDSKLCSCVDKLFLGCGDWLFSRWCFSGSLFS